MLIFHLIYPQCIYRLKVLLVVPIVSVRKQIRQTFSLVVKKVADIPHII